MNYLILTPDGVGSTILQRLITMTLYLENCDVMTKALQGVHQVVHIEINVYSIACLNRCYLAIAVRTVANYSRQKQEILHVELIHLFHSCCSYVFQLVVTIC